MEDGRKAFEAMIDRAKECAVNGGAAIYPLIQDWYHAGAWLPTEQHETVTAMLVDLVDQGALHDVDATAQAWVDAGKPGLPKPVDPYGPEITVDTGGRCPVEGDERIIWRVSGSSMASDAPWGGPVTFRRILADHPGDSYWLGNVETYEPGVTKLDVSEVIHMGNVGGPAVLVYMDQVRDSPLYGLESFKFQRRMKGDA